MTFDQVAVFAVLAMAMVLFIRGPLRYDIVALVALLALVAVGIVPVEHAFSGFGHPAVITVAAVLVISRALQAAGVVDLIVRFLAPTRRDTHRQIGATCGLAALLSAFMNNVGALALMLPVALRNAAKTGRSPSKFLMPLSFASLLGGLVTLIGTPPNIIIATFRVQSEGVPFGMFDFTPVGLSVAVVGLLYITLVGWRLIPGRGADTEAGDRFHIEAYVSEVRLVPESPLVGTQIRKIEQLCENEATVMAILRGKRRLLAPGGGERLEQDDILLLEGDPAALQPLIESGGLLQVGEEEVDPKLLRSDDIRLVEAVVMPNARLEGWSMRGLKMHEHFGVNLLAVSRQGQSPKTRLGSIRFKVGDVILLQGDRTTLKQVLPTLGCLPLAERGLNVVRRRRILLPVGIFAVAIAATALGWVPVQIAFVTAVVALVVSGGLPLREAYRSIEWPIVILLGALIPVGEALHATGGTEVIAGGIITLASGMPLWGMLALLMVSSMLLSDLIHNSPTAVLMAPVAIGIAEGLGLSADAFLMAVAVGAASPYLTPIGHQSNTLVMGPGGYRFGDYWRMGAPLDLLILCVAVPLIVWVWL
jgi:di/tricarboxylate transporter